MKHAIVASFLAVALSGGLAMGAEWTIAGSTFDTTNSVVNGSRAGNISYTSPSTGQVWAPDPAHTVGNLIDGGVTAQGIDITAGGSGSGGRNVFTFWFDDTPPPQRIKNYTGDDFVVYEAGSAGAPECFAVAVRAYPSGVWSQYRYEFADGYETSAGVNSGHFATRYNLSDFGIADGDEADAIRITNIHNANAVTPPNLEDRVDSPTGQGNISQDVGGSVGYAVWQGPLGGGDVPYANSSLDADITYIVALTYLVVPVELSGFSVD